MGRHKKWKSDAERMAAKRDIFLRSAVNELSKVAKCSDIEVIETINEQNKRTNINPVKTDTDKRTSITWHPDINVKTFDGHGRGVPVNGYVLISRKSEPNGNTPHGVVTEADWRARLDQICAHGLSGWSCKFCLDETSNPDS